ncbi:HtaA domain-containing protein [Diaminobutyricimonas sp. TR449]|uniref:HtaA domain-containing protein n=1 Tax=Diaminobutyricimonas sp. TR449 TaxID=2708076 RepID=UPI00142066B3|nr:HtaA domain-containing protein [Diaminobutyricimonas sp. TR449]
MATTPGLTWAVKDSFDSYIERLDDGVIETVDPASRGDAGFEFPLDQAKPAEDTGHGPLQFLGGLLFSGHWGALQVQLREPAIEFSGETGTLWVREHGSSDPTKRLPFADLTVRQRQINADGSTVVEAAALLTGHGRLVLGAQYNAGEPLSDVRITLPPRHA